MPNRTLIVLGNAGRRSPTDAWSRRARLMSGRGLSSRVSSFIAVAKEHDHEWFTVQEAANATGLSVRHLRRLVEQEVGYCPKTLLDIARLESVARALEHTGASISVIAGLHRFSTLPTLSHLFKRYVGESPGNYRRSRCSKGGRNRQVKMAETGN